MQFNHWGNLIMEPNTNYGGCNNWTSNTAGLMMECPEVTEIMIQDSGAHLASFMHYRGNTLTIGRDANLGFVNPSTAGFRNIKINNIKKLC
jgi:hypothetical protein